MTILLAPLPVQSFRDSNGNPLAGGLLYTYQAGTSTLQTTYTDATGGTANTNPVVLNSRGEASVWLTSAQAFKLVLQDSFGVLIWSVDQVASGASSGANSDIVSLSGLTTALSIPQGGTGAVTVIAARAALSAASSGANTDITSLLNPAIGSASATTQAITVSNTSVATTAYANPGPTNFGSAGFTKLASGVIIQWGFATVATANAAQSDAFPLAWPNACYRMTGTMANTGNATTSAVNIAPLSLTNYRTVCATADVVSWIAIGA